MANINDALGAFALGTLSKAAGQDFLTPMLDDVRQRDQFSFQRKQLEAAADRDRKRERKERTDSRRGLLSALQAAGAVRPEDIAAAGGVDILADQDDSEFMIAQQALQRNRLKDMSDEEQRATAIAAARVRGIPVPDNAGRNEVLDLLAQVDYYDLNKEDKKQQEAEARNSWGLRMSSTRTMIEEKLSDPSQVTMDTVAEIAGQLEADARALANDPGLSARDREGLSTLHEMNSRAIQRANRMAEASTIAGGSQADILRAWAERPEMRSSLRVHEPVILAREAAKAGVSLLLSLSDGEIPELDDLKKRVQDRGGPNAIESDGGLAAEAASVAGRLGEYTEQRRINKEKRDAIADGEQMANVIRNALPAGRAAETIDIGSFVDEKGRLDTGRLSETLLQPFGAAIEQASTAELSSMDRSLERAGNFPGVGRLRARISERRTQEAMSMNPSQVRQEAYLAETANYEQVGKALTAESPVVARQTARPSIFPVSVVQPVQRRTVYDVNPDWLAGVTESFRNLDVGLERGLNQAAAEFRQMQVRAGDFADDPDTARALNGFMAGLQVQATQLESRIEARRMIGDALRTLDLSQTEETAKGLSAIAGETSKQISEKTAREQSLADQDPQALFAELQRALETGLGGKAASDEVRRAVGAEITMLKKFMETASALFEGDDAETVKRGLKAAGILSSKDPAFPEVELVRYFMLNR